MVQHSGSFATRVEWLASIDSTNGEAMARARAGERQPLWLAAREQTSGRGRQGRVWASPSGNLAASLLLLDPASMAMAPQLGFVAGVALAEAVASFCPGQSVPKLKWPNDLVHEGAKISGLLLEASQLADGRMACVIGFGVNIAAHPQNLPYAASSLAALGAQVTAELLLGRLVSEMALWLDRWQAGAGFAAIRAAWLGHAAGLGENIRVASGVRTLNGIFRGIDAAGQLILETQAGLESIAAGDVFLAPSNGPAAGQEVG